MYTKELSKEGGFDFSLHDRNTKLGFNDKVNVKKFTKTGTTICAVQHKDGVVFGADTRATAGTVVMDLECTKLHELSNSIMCAGAGTAADLFATINMVSSELQLLSMNTGNSNRINHVEHRLSDYLFRHGGHVGCALIFGGFDVNGAQIVVMSPHGNSMHVPYAAMGSGSLSALSVLETNYRDGMTEKEAIELAADAIQAGIFYDLGSGSNVNIFSVKKDGTEKLYNHRTFNTKMFKDETLFNFQNKNEVLSKYNYQWKDISVEKVEVNNNTMMELC